MQLAMKTFVLMQRRHPELDFDSFKLPLATESSLLQTSSEDVNILDDANNEVTQDSSKSGGNASNGLPK